jgi:hypothetical protein
VFFEAKKLNPPDENCLLNYALQLPFSLEMKPIIKDTEILALVSRTVELSRRSVARDLAFFAKARDMRCGRL